MKKYFETPAVNAAILDADDLIMASTEQLVVKKNVTLGTAKDDSKAADDLWYGAGAGWL